MKHPFARIATLTLCSLSTLACSSEPSVTQIYQYSGAIACKKESGRPLADVQAQLKKANITVHSSETSHDGLNRMAVCGIQTGEIHVFTIAADDVKAAMALGFKTYPITTNKSVPSL